jgi:hypothetical protein
VKDAFKREYDVLRAAIDERREASLAVIEDRVPDTLQSRVLEALQIHHEAVHHDAKEAWDEASEEVAEVTEGFAKFNMDGEFSRETLWDVIDGGPAEACGACRPDGRPAGSGRRASTPRGPTSAGADQEAPSTGAGGRSIEAWPKA